MYKNGIEVIYFAYRPDKKLFHSLAMISSQELLPDSVRIFLTVEDEAYDRMSGDGQKDVTYSIDSKQPGDGASLEITDIGWERPDDGFLEKVRIAADGIRNISVEYIKRSEFGHGRTRQIAMDSSKYEKVLLITQDAVPQGRDLTLNLSRALEDPDAACAYARQTAYRDSDDIEKIYRKFNYPATSRSKTASDIKKMGIKAFFSSDVCCMYKHDIFDTIGGFDKSLKFNEDSIFAFHALKAGYTVEYAADAVVFHSHSDPLKVKFKRSIELAVSQKEHPEVFGSVSSEHEGIRFLFVALRYLVKKKNYIGITKLFMNCIAKYAGYFYGKHFK